MKVDQWHKNINVIHQNIVNCFIPFEEHTGEKNFITVEHIYDRIVKKMKIVVRSEVERQYVCQKIRQCLFRLMDSNKKMYIEGLEHKKIGNEARFFICETRREIEDCKNQLYMKGTAFQNSAEVKTKQRIEYLTNKVNRRIGNLTNKRINMGEKA